MEPDDLIVLFVEGAKHIQAYCREVAQERGLQSLHTAWLTEIVKEHHHCLLIIDAETSMMALPFSIEEIEDYGEGKGVEATNTKLTRALTAMG